MYDTIKRSVMLLTVVCMGYSVQAANLRVVYVDPAHGQSTNSGASWQNALGAEDLQRAIDMASDFVQNSVSKGKPQEAFVLVKGNEKKLGEIVLRYGVNIYGGFDPDCESLMTDEVPERQAVAAPFAVKSKVSRIATSEVDNFPASGLQTIVDGFVVSPSAQAGVKQSVVQPLIDINPKVKEGKNSVPAVAIRNCIVCDADASQSSINIANISNALAYGMLFYNNSIKKGQSTLYLGEQGWGVHLTVEGVATDNAGTSSDKLNYDMGHYRASFINFERDAATRKSFSGYNYYISDEKYDVRALNYQLTEKSVFIDACDAVEELPASLQKLIDYSKDCDLLGNRRLLKGVTASDKSDRGAFETWCVAEGATVATEHTATNPHFYPHEGSVVYLMEGSSLCLGAEQVVTKPGYLLLKEGASLYGQGHEVQVAYLSVEREVKAKGDIVALPYAMGYYYQPVSGTWQNITSNALLGPTTYSYDAQTGVLTLQADVTCKSYNGVKRADTFYRPSDTNSGCWDQLIETDASACQGVNFLPGRERTAMFRFTAKGVSIDDYLYAEELYSGYKSVAFQQHNLESDKGNGQITSSENMGWNCFGIPYLVSDYRPYLGADGETYAGGAYMMQIPRQLWLWYNGKQTPDGGTVDVNGAGFCPVSSWSSDSESWHLEAGETGRLWLGEGIFAQTATFNASEMVDFYLPVYKNEIEEDSVASRTNARFVGSHIGTLGIDHISSKEDEMMFDMYGRCLPNPVERGFYISDKKKVFVK
ncbi:MAG: hypothetical protein Q4B58_04230 [Bacteroidales bacterium]|nr:hypothetical protein [Bacteroidales bacterium]